MTEIADRYGKTAVMVLPIAAVVHNYLLTASVIFIS